VRISPELQCNLNKIFGACCLLSWLDLPVAKGWSLLSTTASSYNGANGPESKTTRIFVRFSRWRHRRRSLPSSVTSPLFMWPRWWTPPDIPNEILQTSFTLKWRRGAVDVDSCITNDVDEAIGYNCERRAGGAKSRFIAVHFICHAINRSNDVNSRGCTKPWLHA